MSRREGAEQPQRSCLGCRACTGRESLIRYVLSPTGEVVPDLDGKLPGRGAYTCLSAVCLTAAVKHRQFSRGFKRDVSVAAADELTGMISALLRERISGGVALANKAGKVVSGGSLVSDALRSPQKPGLVLVATDVSESIGERIESLARLHGVPCVRALTKDEFGDLLGKAPRSAIAVRTGGFVPQLVRAVERYSNFLGEVRQI